jgi:hypothetical protein
MVPLGGFQEAFILIVTLAAIASILFLIALIKAYLSSMKWLIILGIAGIIFVIIYVIAPKEDIEGLTIFLFATIISIVSLYYLLEPVSKKLNKSLGFESHLFLVFIGFALSTLSFLSLATLTVLTIKII